MACVILQYFHSLKQTCLFLFGDQTYPIADSYWMYGGVFFNVSPSRWIGLSEDEDISSVSVRQSKQDTKPEKI